MEAQENRNHILDQKWHVIDDDVYGCFNIANADKPVSELNQDTEINFCAVRFEDVAKHIVELHNKRISF